MLLLGHGFQGDLRVGHRFLQKLLLQRHHKHAQNMAAHCNWNHIAVRMHQISHQAHHIKAITRLHGILILPLDILALLCVVGVLELSQRRLLFAVVSSIIFHGKLHGHVKSFPLRGLLTNSNQ